MELVVRVTLLRLNIVQSAACALGKMKSVFSLSQCPREGIIQLPFRLTLWDVELVDAVERKAVRIKAYELMS